MNKSRKVRFLDPVNVDLYDADGNVVLCACGKPAGQAAYGAESMEAWCNDCSPLDTTEAEFVFRMTPEKEACCAIFPIGPS